MINSINLDNFKNATIGENVEIRADNLIIEDGAVIEDNVTIHAKQVHIGLRSTIQNGTSIKSLSQDMEQVILGDHVLIGFSSQILVPSFKIRDYSQLHNNVLCSGYESLNIGYNCWIAQNSILNCFKELRIGNNVRMGCCQIWTHVASGELLEGCLFHNSAPVVIEDNVWLMGFGHLISPGLTIKNNSIIMAGSIVTKSTEPFSTYSGIPAKNITDKLCGWKKINLVDKVNLMKRFIIEFLNLFPHYFERICISSFNEFNNEYLKKYSNPDGALFFLDFIEKPHELRSDKNTYFCLTMKTYTKKRTQIEIDWMMFSVGYRARFIPITLNV